MGDARLRLLISSKLLDATAAAEDEYMSVSQLFTADATVREVAEASWPVPGRGDDRPSFNPLLTWLESGQADLWDCTTFPPRNISDWPISTYQEKAGARCRTLLDAGWFPSGYLQLIPVGQAPRRATAEQIEDVPYHPPPSSSSDKAATLASPRQELPYQRVQLVQAEGSMPSQILAQVKDRFPAEEMGSEDAWKIRQLHQQEAVARERERWARMEQRIKALEELSSSSAPGKNTAQTVRRMLIKNRATGSPSLPIQDRVYLHCVVVDDSHQQLQEEFLYFSIQDTVGKVLSHFGQEGREVEFLMKIPPNDAGEVIYRRLSVLWRLYEILSKQLLAHVDQVVIRRYQAGLDEATTLLGDDDKMADNSVDVMQEAAGEEARLDTDHIQETGSAAPTTPASDETLAPSYSKITDAILAWEEKNSNRTKQKTSATSEKVRQMHMKSRAKGDAKRIKTIGERFFLELVIVMQNGDECVVHSASPIFLGRVDCISRIARDCAKVPKEVESWHRQFLVQTASNDFASIENTDLTFVDAEKSGILKSFGRIVLRYFPS